MLHALVAPARTNVFLREGSCPTVGKQHNEILVSSFLFAAPGGMHEDPPQPCCPAHPRHDFLASIHSWTAAFDVGGDGNDHWICCPGVCACQSSIHHSTSGRQRGQHRTGWRGACRLAGRGGGRGQSQNSRPEHGEVFQ